MFVRLILFVFFGLFPLTTACSQNQREGEEISLAAAPKKGKAAQGHLIVLDPGHGGFDIGATVQKVEEKTLALKTANLVKRYLANKGYRVILTRSRDLFLPLKKRAAIANDTKSHLFVSLHFNAFKNPTVQGIEVFYYDKGTKWKSSNSKRLAQLVLARMLAQTSAPSRGVKHGNFHVIRETTMPAILIEGGFITHPKERGHLSDQKYLERLALGIAEGIDQYFKKGR